MRKALKLLGTSLAVLLLLVIGVLSWMLWTEGGTRFALRRATAVLPAGIDPGTASGRLGDRLILRDVALELEGLELTVARLWLEWRPRALLSGRLHVVDVGAAGVRYRAAPAEQPPPEPAEPFTLPERVELPVDVLVEKASVEDAELVLSPGADPVAVHLAGLTGLTFANTRLALETLTLDSPLLSARGQVAATAAADYPLDARLDWRLQPDGYAPLTAVTVLTGSLETLDVDIRIESPYRTTIAGTAEHLVSAEQPVVLDVDFQVDSLLLSAVNPDLPGATVGLAANVEGPVDDLAIEADLSGEDAEARRVVARLRAAYTGDAVAVRELTVRQAGQEGEIAAAGRIELEEAPHADLNVQWTMLHWPLTGQPTVSSPRGRLSLDGGLDDYRLALDASVEPEGAPAVQLEADGRGDRRSIDLSLAASSGEAEATGRAEASWEPAVTADVTLALRSFDPSVLAADWPGGIDLDVAATARIEEQALRVSVPRLAASGTLRDQPLSVAGTGSLLQGEGPPQVLVDELEAALGTTRLALSGSLAERADLRWQVASDDLAAALPGARGTLSGSGSVTGPVPRVKVEAELEARSLAYEANTLEHLILSADVDLAGGTASRLQLEVRDASVAENTIQRLTVEGSGRPAEHGLGLSLVADSGNANLELTGRLEDAWSPEAVWSYRLQGGRLAYQELAPWLLQPDSTGLVAADRVQVGRQCWQTDQAEVCLEGARSREGLTAELALADLQFGYFGAFAPEGMTLSGSVNGTARLRREPAGAVTADAAFETTAGSFTLPLEAASADARTIRLAPSRLELQLQDAEGSAMVELNLEHGRLYAVAATSGAGDPAAADPAAELSRQPLTGRVEIDVPDLGFVGELLSPVEELNGRISGGMRVAGTVGEPRLDGALRLEEGYVSVPGPGINLEDLRLIVEGQGRALALRASARSGDGTLQLDGDLNLPGQAPLARIGIRGDEFEVLDNDDGQVFVSPDLLVTADAEQIAIEGELHVPRAELTPGTRSPSAVTVSSDQVLLSEDETQAAETGRDLSAEVRLTLGDEVSFTGFGLTARFEGNVLVNQQPQSPTTATGELTIAEGEYRAYGQGLVIDSGRIYFAGGPVTQPALDVRAVRRPEEGILVGAHVQGTLQDPSFELFSEPPMTQQQQLSWLVLGRSPEAAPEGQESALNRAALAMGLRGGDFLAKNIGEELGFDEVGIETGSGEAGAPSDPNQASLVVGKYLSPRLYVSYGIGLFNPETVLELQYEISRKWTLVTQSSGASTGADLLYTVEVGEGTPEVQ